jgi:hypothetical protein
MFDGPRDAPAFQELSVVACDDLECSNVKQVFLLAEERAVIKAFDFEDASLSGSLTLPDDSIVPLVFIEGAAVVNLSLPGLHTAVVTAEREGFADAEETVLFNVLEEDFQLSAPACNADGLCDPEESSEACPSDCTQDEIEEREAEALPVEAPSWFEENIALIVGGGVIVLTVLYFLAKRTPKKKRKK